MSPQRENAELDAPAMGVAARSAYAVFASEGSEPYPPAMAVAATAGDKLVVGTSIRWAVPPARDLASKTREMIALMCRDLLDEDEVDSIAMVAHELLENLFKYAVAGVASFGLEISERSGELWVEVQTRNRAAAATRNHIAAFARSLEASDTPLALYDELIAKSPFREGSGLGLARISGEGQMHLSIVVEGEEVALRATRRLTERKAS